MTWQTRGPIPPNPYARAGEPGEAAVRERLAALEVEVRHLVRDADTAERANIDQATRISDLERLGRDAIASLPQLLTAHTAPLEARIKALETGWWVHLQPHAWKLWAMLALIVLARVYKAVTGASLDIIALLSLLKG